MIEQGSNGSDRLLTLRLNTAAGPVTIVSVYAPTSDTKVEFYENLAAIISSSVLNNEQLVLLGDFNIIVGVDYDTCPVDYDYGRSGRRLRLRWL